MNKLYLLFLLAMLFGCSSSDDMSGDGGSTAGSDTNVDASDGNIDEGSSAAANTDLAAHDTDVYDPNNTVPNACSSLLWDSVAGTYEGTIRSEGQGDSTTCTWNVVVTMKRVYEPNTSRSVCNLATTYRSSLTDEIHFTEPSIAQCQDFNATSVVATRFTDEELSNPNWPVSLLMEMNSATDPPFEVLPIAKDRYNPERMTYSAVINVESSGSMYEFVEPVLAGAPNRNWTWNIQRTERDDAP